MDKGFYIFKNSWGTTSFGVDNDYGPGYGYISQRYVNEFGRIQAASGLPTDVEPPTTSDEICDDGLDNDDNGMTDCEDPVCSDNSECVAEDQLHFEGEAGMDIPDNDPVGVSSVITVEDGGSISGLQVNVGITHTYRGDLTVSLHHDGQAVVLQDRAGGSADDLVDSFEVTDFDGADMAGEWKLVVTDGAARDVGSLDSWSLDVFAN
jgi:hypothetical protein